MNSYSGQMNYYDGRKLQAIVGQEFEYSVLQTAELAILIHNWGHP